MSLHYRIFAAALGVAALTPARAFAWGPVGHQVGAYIAEDNLTDAARHGVEAILGRDVALADVANWADAVRQARPDTASWHFIDIPDRENVTKADEPKFCPQNSCVVGQINSEINALKSAQT